MSNSKTPPIHSLSVLKGICAILVIAAHSSMGEYTHFCNVLSRDIGMTSIFYAITGYFLFKPNATNKEIEGGIVKSAKKIIPIILITHIVYFFTYLPLPPFSLENKVFYFKWLILGDGGALWYMTALLHGLIFLWVFNYLFKGKYFGFLLLLLLFRFLCEDYWEVFMEGSRTNLEKNAFAYSIPMLTMGMLIRKHEKKLLSQTNYLPWTAGILCLIYLNEFYLKDILPSFIQLRSLINGLAPFLCILLALQYKSIGAKTALHFIGERLSANMYYWHGLILFIGSRLFNEAFNYNFSFLYCLICSILLSYLIYYTQKKIGVHLL